MRKLSKPGFAVSVVFADCVARVADEALKAKYANISTEISEAESNYEAAAAAESLHTIDQVPTVAGVVSTEEMRGLYKSQMSAANGAGRAYYDALRNAAPNNKCPLCGVGVVSTLDHHLPQSRYPDLSVAPLNLVPACADCNKAKLAKYPTSAGEQTIHPYFDDFTQTQWLHAVLDQGPPLILRYETITPAGWRAVDGQRASRHFTVFKLGALFGANANDELATLKPRLVSLFEAGGEAAVQSHLAEQAVMSSTRLNSWQHALYKALSQDGWFCGGGFGNIPDPQ